jgi:hypothetical protein
MAAFSSPTKQCLLKAKSERNNMRTKLIICSVAALTVIIGTQAQSRAGNALPVTPDNFVRAETDRYFGKMAKNGPRFWTAPGPFPKLSP